MAFSLVDIATTTIFVSERSRKSGHVQKFSKTLGSRLEMRDGNRSICIQCTSSKKQCNDRTLYGCMIFDITFRYCIFVMVSVDVRLRRADIGLLFSMLCSEILLRVLRFPFHNKLRELGELLSKLVEVAFYGIANRVDVSRRKLNVSTRIEKIIITRFIFESVRQDTAIDKLRGKLKLNERRWRTSETIKSISPDTLQHFSQNVEIFTFI